MIKILNRRTGKRLWNKNEMPSDSFRRRTIRRLADLLRPLTFITLVFCLGCAPPQLAAQGSGDIKAADTSSPRDTLRSFIEACNELHQHITADPGYYDRANPEHVAIAERVLDCIDGSELPAFARTDRAGEACSFTNSLPVRSASSSPIGTHLRTVGNSKSLARS